MLNPASGFVQNCNSSPFTTTDAGNPDRAQFPRYMVEDADDDKRRAKRVAARCCGEMHDVTLDDLKLAAYDTTLYWPQQRVAASMHSKFADLVRRRSPSPPARSSRISTICWTGIAGSRPNRRGHAVHRLVRRAVSATGIPAK